MFRTSGKARLATLRRWKKLNRARTHARTHARAHALVPSDFFRSGAPNGDCSAFGGQRIHHLSVLINLRGAVCTVPWGWCYGAVTGDTERGGGGADSIPSLPGSQSGGSQLECGNLRPPLCHPAAVHGGYTSTDAAIGGGGDGGGGGGPTIDSTWHERAVGLSVGDVCRGRATQNVDRRVETLPSFTWTDEYSDRYHHHRNNHRHDSHHDHLHHYHSNHNHHHHNNNHPTKVWPCRRLPRWLGNITRKTNVPAGDVGLHYALRHGR